MVFQRAQPISWTVSLDFNGYRGGLVTLAESNSPGRATRSRFGPYVAQHIDEADDCVLLCSFAKLRRIEHAALL